MLSATVHNVLAKRMQLLSHIRRWNSTSSVITSSSRAQYYDVPTLSTDVVTAKHTNHHELLSLGNHLRKPLTSNKHSLTNDIRMYSSLATNIISSPRPSAIGNNHNIQHTIRTNFSYAGPRKLSDILKVELLDSKSSTEISDLWMTYHEGKEKVHGLTLDKSKGKSILARAVQCPFFIQPVFREEGHFMIISQFQSPNHFLLAFLEDYKMDPARAQPLVTVSIFDDMAEDKDLMLVRCDIIAQGIGDDEGYNICKCLLDDYAEEEHFRNVHMFNKKPDAFNVDEFVKEKEERWKV